MLRRIARPGLLMVGALLAAALLLAQTPGQQQPPPEEKKQEKKEEKPRKRVFTGKITLRSSRQESETASYGFKGIGPDGQVEQSVLAAQPTSDDYLKTARLSTHRPQADELQAFLAQGGLHTKEKKP